MSRRATKQRRAARRRGEKVRMVRAARFGAAIRAVFSDPEVKALLRYRMELEAALIHDGPLFTLAPKGAPGAINLARDI